MIMTPNLFHHIPLIYFKLAKTKKNWKSHHINQICGFTHHFLALFDTFSVRYGHSVIAYVAKNAFYKKGELKLIFFNEFFLERFR